MPDRDQSDHTALIAVFAVFVLNSPFTNWWTSLGLPWHAMFIPWGVIILLIAVNQIRGR